MKTTLLILILGLFISAFISVSVVANPPPNHPRLKPHEAIQKNAEAWGISQATLQQILELAKAARPLKKENHDKLRAARRLLHQLLDQDSPKLNEVMSQVETIGKLETQKRKHALTVLIQMRSLLTPDQRQKLKAALPHPRPKKPRHKH